MRRYAITFPKAALKFLILCQSDFILLILVLRFLFFLEMMLHHLQYLSALYTLQMDLLSPLTVRNFVLSLSLHLRRTFPWVFTIADVSQTIIGADFLKHFDLLVDLRRQCLID